MLAGSACPKPRNGTGPPIPASEIGRTPLGRKGLHAASVPSGLEPRPPCPSSESVKPAGLAWWNRIPHHRRAAALEDANCFVRTPGAEFPRSDKLTVPTAQRSASSQLQALGRFPNAGTPSSKGKRPLPPTVFVALTFVLLAGTYSMSCPALRRRLPAPSTGRQPSHPTTLTKADSLFQLGEVGPEPGQP